MVGNDQDLGSSNGRKPADFQINRFRSELTSRTVTSEFVACEDLEDVFGGIARGFKLLESFAVDDAYDSAADTPDREDGKSPPELKAINKEIARGDGSARFRDKKKGGSGGTWANYEALNPIHAMPERNFNPTGTAASVPLYRDNFEQGPYVVKDESCFRCGISCHKNVYDKDENGKPGKYKAKLDFEPLNLLSSNLGIFDPEQACQLIELVDEMGMDSISCGVTLSYAMQYNRRHQEAPVAKGLSYGDFDATRDAIERMGMGVVLQIPSAMCHFCDGQTSFEFEASDVAMLIEQLWERYPKLKSRMLDRNDKLFSYFLLMHNDRQLTKLNLNDVPVADGDRITFIALAEGG